MKIVTFLTLFLLSLNSFAQHIEIGKWYPVYSCDNGAMVIDRAVTGLSGNYRQISHQLVIRDRNIIDWFVSNGAVYSAASYNEIIYDQLSPRFENELYHSDRFLTKSVKFYYKVDNINIYLDVYGSGKANWYFRSCQKTEFTDRF